MDPKTGHTMGQKPIRHIPIHAIGNIRKIIRWNRRFGASIHHIKKWPFTTTTTAKDIVLTKFL